MEQVIKERLKKLARPCLDLSLLRPALVPATAAVSRIDTAVGVVTVVLLV